jgi:hypothetical protein
VIEVAEELVEAVIRRQMLVKVAQMVLAELPGGIALLFQKRGDGDVLFLHALRRARHAHLAEAGAKRRLPGDEGRPAGGAGLLAVIVGEHDPFVRDPVDIRRLIANQAKGVGRDVGNADIVAPDGQDVRLVVLRLRSDGCQRQQDRGGGKSPGGGGDRWHVALPSIRADSAAMRATS